jgi:RNA polymerase sigma-70 factor, ECF subfamily
VELATLADRALVARSQQGDRDAFSSLVVRYQDRVLNLAFRRLGDRDVALDVAQEVFLKAYRALDRFQGDAKFFTWLFRITMNETITARRKGERQMGGRRGPASLDHATAGGDQLPEPAAGAEGPSDLVERQDDQAMVQAAIEELDDELAQVILLRDIEGLSYQEVAETLELPLGSVKSRLYRARQALKARLAPRVKERS